ncbi:MAG: hypothetical protein HY903_19470 [Deltaproteobacteria bacterium]|nr:hypothetical protein [Deltaproteobacteria bacterium]
MAKKRPPLPPSVLRSLRALGRGIDDARRRRRIPVAVLADRGLIARGTLRRVCTGDPGASMGAYASVLFALGLGERLEMLAPAGADTVGLQLEDERLPKRVRRPRPRSPSAPLRPRTS